MTVVDLWRAWLLVLGMVGSTTTSQLCFKMAGLHSVRKAALVPAWIFNPWLWVALVSSAIGMVFWLLALRRLPLSAAYPWTAMVYVLTPLGSAFLFQDTLSMRYILGMTCIVSGVFITASGASKHG